MPSPDPRSDSSYTEWRALGVDFEAQGTHVDELSGPTLRREDLDLKNDGVPPYDAIVVQRRTVSLWSDEPCQSCKGTGYHTFPDLDGVTEQSCSHCRASERASSRNEVQS